MSSIQAETVMLSYAELYAQRLSVTHKDTIVGRSVKRRRRRKDVRRDGGRRTAAALRGMRFATQNRAESSRSRRRLSRTHNGLDRVGPSEAELGRADTDVTTKTSNYFSSSVVGFLLQYRAAPAGRAISARPAAPDRNSDGPSRPGPGRGGAYTVRAEQR